MTKEKGLNHFNELDIHHVLDCVEEQTKQRCSNLCRALNSYINRVYDVELQNGESVVIKFYRPGRWDALTLQDEHRFLTQLADAELPVIAPLKNAEGETLHQLEGIHYALFPKKGGRLVDEPSQDQWLQIGRLLGHVHLIGASEDCEHRVTFTPRKASREHLNYIMSSNLVAPEVSRAYETAAAGILTQIEPLFDDTPLQRIHGDLHVQNLIFRPDEGFYMIDFDDMAMGPAAQDLWMLLPGRVVDTPAEVNLLLEGYETFTNFDTSTLKLIEPLRAMRFLHFTSWCVRQAKDGGYSKLSHDWGSTSYWRNEVAELQRQKIEIDDALNAANIF